MGCRRKKGGAGREPSLLNEGLSGPEATDVVEKEKEKAGSSSGSQEGRTVSLFKPRDDVRVWVLLRESGAAWAAGRDCFRFFEEVVLTLSCRRSSGANRRDVGQKRRRSFWHRVAAREQHHTALGGAD